jgi:MscS family membrane protein
MNDFFQQVWWDNAIKNYSIVAGTILFIWLFKKYISRYVAGLLYGLVHTVWKDVDKNSFINLVVKPLGLFLSILVSIVALYKLNFPQALNAELYKYTIKEIIHCIGNIILIVSFVALLIRTIDFIALVLEKRANRTADLSDNQLIVFFKDFFKVILVIIGIMLVLRYAFDLNIGGLLTGLSIVGAAIALALRESLENLIASFIIFFDKPFITGDVVKVLNVTGSVEKIGLRSTRIRTEQKTFVTVPNKQMVDSIVDNQSLRTKRKVVFKLELTKQTTIEKMKTFMGLIDKALATNELIEEHTVFLTEVSKLGNTIQVEYFTLPMPDEAFNKIREAINFKVLQLLQQEDIDMAGAAATI